MGTASSPVTELLRLGTIREILQSRGPCITILLPRYRPGEPTGSPAALLKENIQEAARLLGERALSKSNIASLVHPLEDIAKDPALAAGSYWGRAIFRSPDVLQQFHLTAEVDPLLRIGGSFAIRPLAAELSRPRVFFILGLSKERVALLRCAGFHGEIAKLPSGVPETLAEAMALEPPDHDLENRSTAGGSAGAMHRVRFGTGSGREQQHAHLADYYKLVDRGIHQILHEPDIPLILAGVDEDTARYRTASSYHFLVKQNISGSYDFTRDHTEILKQAYEILREDAFERQRAAFLAAKDHTPASHVVTDPDIILRAAFEGRVGQLYLNETAERLGVFDRDNYRSWGQEDLLNLAAVQTIIHHGKCCTLPAKTMRNGWAAVGMMRF